MDWLDYLFEFDLELFDSDHQQRRDLSRHEKEIRLSNTRSYSLETRVGQLERENGELKLVCLALMKTLLNHELVTKESFIQLIKQIDAEDGRQNGRYEGSILPEPEPRPKSEIKINFSSLTKKPESSDS